MPEDHFGKPVIHPNLEHKPPADAPYFWFGAVHYLDRDNMKIEIVSRHEPAVMCHFKPSELREYQLAKEERLRRGG